MFYYLPAIKIDRRALDKNRCIRLYSGKVAQVDSNLFVGVILWPTNTFLLWIRYKLSADVTSMVLVAVITRTHFSTIRSDSSEKRIRVCPEVIRIHAYVSTRVPVANFLSCQ